MMPCASVEANDSKLGKIAQPLSGCSVVQLPLRQLISPWNSLAKRELSSGSMPRLALLRRGQSRALDPVGSKNDNTAFSRGRSSVGRALQWHCRGRRFDPVRLHHTCPHRLVWPRTPPFHGGNRGSNPLGTPLSRGQGRYGHPIPVSSF